MDESYYLIDNAGSYNLRVKSQVEAAKVPNLIVGGHLGGYKYYAWISR